MKGTYIQRITYRTKSSDVGLVSLDIVNDIFKSLVVIVSFNYK